MKNTTIAEQADSFRKLLEINGVYTAISWIKFYCDNSSLIAKENGYSKSAEAYAALGLELEKAIRKFNVNRFR